MSRVEDLSPRPRPVDIPPRKDTMKRATISISLAGLAALGAIVAALTIAPTASASWDWTNLPTGYRVSGASDGQCPGDPGRTQNFITIDGQSIFPSTCDPAGFQAAVDAYVDSTICSVNPAAGGAACAPPATSTEATSTTDPATTAGTTTDAVSTTTTATSTETTSPAQTTPTSTDPAQTTTAAVTLTPTEQGLQDQIDKLAAQISALTTRVDRLEKASDAAWLAYQQAIQAGDDPSTAAAIARGTAMNVIYGLGDFAA